VNPLARHSAPCRTSSTAGKLAAPGPFPDIPEGEEPVETPATIARKHQEGFVFHHQTNFPNDLHQKKVFGGPCGNPVRQTSEKAKYSSDIHCCIERGEFTQDLVDQRDAWDELNARHIHHPLRAVIGVEDLDNAYIDRSQKRLVSRAVGLEPHYTVLDYGCGVGRWTLWFARQVHRVVGVDISPKMVEAARQAADAAAIRNVEHHAIDGIPLPFEDGAFDLVNAVWVLRYITDDDELARTVHDLCRIVRPGGHVTFIEMIARRQPELREHEGEFSGPTVYRRWEEYRSLFEACGMTMKESTVSSASPLYWPYALVRKNMRRWNFPNLVSPAAPAIISASLAGEPLTAGLMRFLADRHLIYCQHRFFCFQKSEDGHAAP
jgi:ubiquinone/menaquinone biosynthesis C-methylase UbiE